MSRVQRLLQRLHHEDARFSQILQYNADAVADIACLAAHNEPRFLDVNTVLRHPTCGRQAILDCIYLSFRQGFLRDLETLCHTWILMDRACHRANNSFRLNRNTVLTTFVGCVIISHKMHKDQAYSNKIFAKLFKADIKRINAIEAELLCMMKWDAWVRRSEYEVYLENMCCCEVE